MKIITLGILFPSITSLELAHIRCLHSVLQKMKRESDVMDAVEEICQMCITRYDNYEWLNSAFAFVIQDDMFCPPGMLHYSILTKLMLIITLSFWKQYIKNR